MHTWLYLWPIIKEVEKFFLYCGSSILRNKLGHPSLKYASTITHLTMSMQNMNGSLTFLNPALNYKMKLSCHDLHDPLEINVLWGYFCLMFTLLYAIKIM